MIKAFPDFSPVVRLLALQSTVLTVLVQTLFSTWSFSDVLLLRPLRINSLPDKLKEISPRMLAKLQSLT